MYFYEAKKQQEIEQLSSELENFNKVRLYGPDIIDECKKKMVIDAENMEKYQYRINSITSILRNYSSNCN